jgi:hypothetical protein
MKLGLAVGLVVVAFSSFAAYDSICPGQEWLDTDGKPIHAHGGSILTVGDTYYWYGENKEFTTGLTNIWHWGVNLYSSKDLMNWKHEGIVIPPDLKDPTSPLAPASCMDRPHILYNERTKKYVCWLKIMKPDSQGMTVMVADALKGPWTMVTQGLAPCGMSGGDFDLVKADDGKAYYYFERVHSELICADLTDDYTGVTGYYSTHAPRRAPPYVREAPAHFLKDGKHYLLTSGTTGYCPNPTEAFVADTWHGPWTSLGDPCVNDTTRTSFHSQFSSVFKVPGKKNLYIALGDRWMPAMMDLTYAECEAAYACWFKLPYDQKAYEAYEKRFAARKAEWKAAGKDCSPFGTKMARYTWLPITFENGKPTIHWRDSWKPSDFE